MGGKKGREVGECVVGNKEKNMREEWQKGHKEESSCKKRQEIQGTENKGKGKRKIDKNEERKEEAGEREQRKCKEDILTR